MGGRPRGWSRWLKAGQVALAGCLVWGAPSWALDCPDLATPAKTRAFIERAKASNPLYRDNLSVWLQMSPCEGPECDISLREARLGKMQNIHLLRQGDNLRAYVAKGPKSGQCIINRGSRMFLCSDCDANSNSACRSLVRQEGSGWIQGTNIDTTDFDLLTHPQATNECAPVPSPPGFIQMTTTLAAKGLAYDKIVSFFDKEREVPITLQFYQGGVLSKVYRFFPTSFTQVDGKWISTAVRVRTTQGDEKHFVFETQVMVEQDPQHQYKVYVDPAQDPALDKEDVSVLFTTK